MQTPAQTPSDNGSAPLASAPISAPYDLLVVGGGINGTGIARDAAGRGLRVLLVEQDDLASHTSSASTKLIHGGLRYLEYYEFGLVRKALQEREVLLRAAPHIMWPLRFVMPHMPNLRPAWMIRAGLFLYDHLARREILPGSRGIDLRQHPAGAPLRQDLTRGFVYSDGWVQDARLVVLNAQDAAERGATILTRTRLVGAERGEHSWTAQLETTNGERQTVRARAIVNAAGPWVGHLLGDVLRQPATHRIRNVKGSHIVTRKLFDHDHAYIFQNPDKRIIFAIPYERDFTLIGTTDLEYLGDPAKVEINEDEIAYLCKSASEYFTKPIVPADVVWTYAGVRPLMEEEVSNPSAVTRDYKLELDAPGTRAPLLSVFGGKITTYRRLAEEAMSHLHGALGFTHGDWTAGAPLPGGDMAEPDAGVFETSLRAQMPWLPSSLAYRYAHTYGTRTHVLVGDANSLDGLGTRICGDLYEAELRYLVQYEWARTAQDVLWRRTKLGLHVGKEGAASVERWFAQHLEMAA
ncbi:glycerol-3-phosphate dehydrogenase [Pandoraea aquatica]|uniref:Glycerol-3-phosphate dehydrogenase n=1 Tax=Pandoraea aquatica TaxID=2508290 RepID=A0A5E4T2J0_9BURK|nr:glycerol-3-phosphate dehydrogenase [Pandoraea aquatica]